MAKTPPPVRSTHEFVLTQGFCNIGNFKALVTNDGKQRLFAELVADPDRPDVRAADAYRSVLASMQPGWGIRILQVFWPDQRPRQLFQEHLQKWPTPKTEGTSLLYDSLVYSADSIPLPFSRRTILEFVYPGNEGLTWWEGLVGIFRSYGVLMQYLNPTEVQQLIYRIFNPMVEQS